MADPAIDEALAATFGPDAAAPEPQDAAPSAPSASEAQSGTPPTAPLSTDPSETVDAATPTETAPEAEAPDLAAQIADMQAHLTAAEDRAQQAESARARIERERAEEQERGQREHNDRLRAFALQRVQERLQSPEDLDPAQYQQLRTWETQLTAQPHAERASRAEQDVERLAAYITVQKLGAAYGLAEAEAEAMAGMPTPQAMEQYARSIAEARTSKETEMADLRQQLNDLQLQVAAQGRRDSGADTTNSGTGAAPPAKRPDEAADFDEYWTLFAADLPTKATVAR